MKHLASMILLTVPLFTGVANASEIQDDVNAINQIFKENIIGEIFSEKSYLAYQNSNNSNGKTEDVYSGALENQEITLYTNGKQNIITRISIVNNKFNLYKHIRPLVEKICGKPVESGSGRTKQSVEASALIENFNCGSGGACIAKLDLTSFSSGDFIYKQNGLECEFSYNTQPKLLDGKDFRSPNTDLSIYASGH